MEPVEEKGEFAVTVVIPTYNRNAQLLKVLRALRNSDVSRFSAVEIIVVDDGSPDPVSQEAAAENFKAPFSVQVIRQKNSGPAKARNEGFRRAKYDFVMFLDDDVIVEPDLIEAHALAHQAKEGAVIFGLLPYLEPENDSADFRYLSALTDSYLNGNERQEFVRSEIVASGNLSLHKSDLPEGDFYASHLTVPAAEEFELEHRLNAKGVPIYLTSSALGWHLQEPTIESKCQQEYKYGLGAAEVALKEPEVRANQHLARILANSGPVEMGREPIAKSAVKLAKSLLVASWSRRLLLASKPVLVRLLPSKYLLFRYFRFVIGLHLFAGVRDGMKKFG